MKQLKILIISILSLLAPVNPVLITALVLVIADFITGVISAKKRGELITSSGIKRTVIKLFVYEVAITLGFLAQTYMIGDMVPVQKLIASFVALTELTSIIENLNELSGGSLLAALISKLGAKKDELSR